ncbi:hypothetical protein PR003_g18258 [Phytophthora rubi]|uniref:DDE-1 domain-containing protein n=1 Tax=Phytophthora rubi TaxID=129364 RepID=A0A6A4E231_9STRA|nr:hypothetical protein PR001_g17360 [Phytophthora rubi]KAE9318318.1 hypothetical protein PR003_g18258 [Phytophthora rubi]
MLLADNTGQKYDPWVVFKIRPSTVATTRDENTGFRHGFSRVMWQDMEALEKETRTAIFANGWWNSDLSLQYLQHFFGHRSRTDDPVMLIWDDFSAHWTADIIAFAAKKNVVLQRVPPGYTHCCQPADISWNKPLKDRMRLFWTAYLKAECSKVLACSGEKEPKLTPPDRKRVLCWLHAAWSGLSTTSVKGGFKRIDLLFDGRDNTPSRSVESTEVEDGLVDALQALSWLDAEVGDVCWDDDIVDRHIYQEEA